MKPIPPISEIESDIDAEIAELDTPVGRLAQRLLVKLANGEPIMDDDPEDS